MDPNTTLLRLMDAIQNDRPCDIEDNLKALWGWAGMGGFKPEPRLCRQFLQMDLKMFSVTKSWDYERNLIHWLSSGDCI